MWDFKEMDQDLEQIKDSVNYFLKSTQKAPKVKSVPPISNSFSLQNLAANSEENDNDLSTRIEQAIGEIKEYVIDIWNDNEKREEYLEKLLDELNNNLTNLHTEREKLKDLQSQRKLVEGKMSAVKSAIDEVLSEMQGIENRINEIIDIYAEANEKGWKIIFYPRLAVKVLKLETSNEEESLNKKIELYMNAKDDLYGENAKYMENEVVIDECISDCFKSIAQAEVVIDTQKNKLGQLKEQIVRWSNAYIYYSMLQQKIESLNHRFEFEKDVCEDFDAEMLTQQAIEELLDLWQKNANDEDTVYQILQDMGKSKYSNAFGKEIGQVFDDTQYLRSRFEKIKGIQIQSGYIIDGIKVLYEIEASMLHGGLGGSEGIIVFDEDDELRKVEGEYDVPYMKSSGDAIAKLKITTKKGKVYSNYGSGNGKAFCIEIPEACHFIGFYGKESSEGNGGFLTKLGVLYI